MRPRLHCSIALNYHVGSAPASPNLNGERLLALLEDAVADPWGPDAAANVSAAGLALHAALDRAWLAHEGGTRLLAAVGLALAELSAAGAVPRSMLSAVVSVADQLTLDAKQRHQHERPPLPDVHSCIASVARARVLHAAGSDASWNALQELAAPTSSARLSSSVLH